MKKYEKYIEKLLFVSATVSILSVLLITIFIFKEGVEFFSKNNLLSFLMGTNWAPTKGSFGILPMIVGSLLVTLGALILGIPIGLGCAIYMAELSNPKLRNFLKPIIELLAGIPSVVYGFFGLLILVPFIRERFGGVGFSVLSGSIILAIMILPTIISISENAIRSVPDDFKKASLSLGASHWETIKFIVLPAARSGIIAAIILGMGRAIGETMAVIMVTGNVPKIPTGILSPVRTLTGGIALEMGYASGMHQKSLFAMGVVLFVIIMLLNSIANLFPKESR